MITTAPTPREKLRVRVGRRVFQPSSRTRTPLSTPRITIRFILRGARFTPRCLDSIPGGAWVVARVYPSPPGGANGGQQDACAVLVLVHPTQTARLTGSVFRAASPRRSQPSPVLSAVVVHLSLVWNVSPRRRSRCCRKWHGAQQNGNGNGIAWNAAG
ncbi:hypothetical protein BC827DRAFT_258821 [Russula dissimulans]|jgi:hypothetical protein|nr:hypothetical protein BC827DRAFT_258821 [Russula dissimulans]